MKKTVCTFTISSITLSLLINLALSAQPERKIETTIHDFMEDYTKPAIKAAKKGKPEYIEKILIAIPSFALEEQKQSGLKFLKKL
ncbi:hypothetical protein LEP1GSC170_2786 [Leptospira interrogans serovar Bataviae str. HAI135]|nr:hypothetical protein LEP1GSC170_2786 [Leptospira interrogans serovar Bataviae str. HAI135]